MSGEAEAPQNQKKMSGEKDADSPQNRKERSIEKEKSKENHWKCPVTFENSKNNLQNQNEMSGDHLGG